MLTDEHKLLNGYNENLESLRGAAFERLLHSLDREDQIAANQQLASFTAMRSPAFIAGLERLMGLRND